MADPVCVQTMPAGHLPTSQLQGKETALCLLDGHLSSQLGLQSSRGHPHGWARVVLCGCVVRLLPRCSSALPSWQPWNSTWKMRFHLVTPQGKTTAGGGQCSKRSTPSFGIDIKSHGMFLETSGIFQASNFPSMLKRLPLFPIHLHHQNYCLLSFYLHHTLLLPLTPRGQLLRCHLSLFMKRAGMCMH